MPHPSLYKGVVRVADEQHFTFLKPTTDNIKVLQRIADSKKDLREA